MSSPTIFHMFSQLDSSIPYSAWAQLGQDIDGEAATAESGTSVSLSADGRTVAIGAIGNDGTTGTASDNRGHVRIYSYNGSAWSQLGSDIDGEASGDQSGFSVSLSADGRTVAIGAPGNDGTTGTDQDNRGHVRIYSYSAGSWSQLGSDIDGEALVNQSGWSVSLSADGEIVAIGAICNSSNGNTNNGHVRIYKYDATKNAPVTDQSMTNFGPIGWNRLGSDIDGQVSSDQFGTSVSLSADGRTVAIGATNNDSNGSNSGYVRIFSYNGTAWSQLGSDIDGEAAGDESGRSVSLSADGRTVAIGAYLNDGNDASSGHVRIYSYGGAAWSQLGSDIDGEADGDQSGWSVSLSADGRTVAIGARYNDDTGTYSGHVRIYSYSGSAWSQLGSDIDGEAADDRSGWSVSLSADGRTVAIGAIYNDGTTGNGNDNRGHVRIYNIDSVYVVNDTITVGAVFSEPVIATNSPNLNILTNIDGTTKLFSYASGTGTNVLYFTKTINSGENIDPLKILSSSTPTINGIGTIRDSDGNYAVLTLSSDVTFQSTVVATNSLSLSSYLPTDIDNILMPTINLTFSENVYGDSGNIIIKQKLDDIAIETINVMSFNISGKNATYTLTNSLKYNQSYYIDIDATAIVNYASISDKSITFSTKKKYSSSLYENGRWENPEYLDTFTGNKRMFGGGNQKYGTPSTQGRPAVMFSIVAKRTSTKKWNMFG